MFELMTKGENIQARDISGKVKYVPLPWKLSLVGSSTKKEDLSIWKRVGK